MISTNQMQHVPGTSSDVREDLFSLGFAIGRYTYLKQNLKMSNSLTEIIQVGWKLSSIDGKGLTILYYICKEAGLDPKCLLGTGNFGAKW